eukprot:CAMPEP_0114254442 /NCGR_PEP_ID=MMETSP0058-20121206/16980_1 /TAXON_ID=36894 /ORGANISM="Pyramimonas parkeae, CCMP726" /LENGTH=346 /DNA_ID=CAMNT_0001368659 /DNA_START=99 /DNA_END=1135 /DNA_ORIENTATION=-
MIHLRPSESNHKANGVASSKDDVPTHMVQLRKTNSTVGSPVDNRAPVKSPTGHMVQLKRTESVAREKAAAPAVSDAPAQMVQLRKTEKQVHAPAGESAVDTEAEELALKLKKANERAESDKTHALPTAHLLEPKVDKKKFEDTKAAEAKSKLRQTDYVPSAIKKEREDAMNASGRMIGPQSVQVVLKDIAKEDAAGDKATAASHLDSNWGVPLSHLTEGEAALRRARMKIYADEKAVSVREATRRPDAVKSEPSLHKEDIQEVEADREREEEPEPIPHIGLEPEPILEAQPQPEPEPEEEPEEEPMAPPPSFLLKSQYARPKPPPTSTATTSVGEALISIAAGEEA